jgi:hypothetical protein
MKHSNKQMDTTPLYRLCSLCANHTYPAFYVHVCGVILVSLVFSVFQKKLRCYMTPAGDDVFLSDGAGLLPGKKQNLLLEMDSSKIERRLGFDSTVQYIQK